MQSDAVYQGFYASLEGCLSSELFTACKDFIGLLYSDTKACLAISSV